MKSIVSEFVKAETASFTTTHTYRIQHVYNVHRSRTNMKLTSGNKVQGKQDKQKLTDIRDG